MINPDVAMTFLNFVEQRHVAWLQRQAGLPGPWSDDPIVQRKKFTNVFRILDHGSQFVLTDLIDPDLSPRDQLARLFLYRHTGRVESWEYLELMMGSYPVVAELDDVLRVMKEYRGKSRPSSSGPTHKGGKSKMTRVFERSIFTSAYLVFPQTQTPGSDKLDSIIQLTQRLFDPSSPEDVMPDFLDSTDPERQFNALRRNKGVADFMSMQILTDWGYTPHCGEDREDHFVVAGPGARKGAAELDPTARPEDVVEWAVEAMASSPDCPLLPLDEYGEYLRAPSYMDAQNTLCEFSKYVRYAVKDLPAKPYRPAHPGPQPRPVLPQHW